MENIDIAGVQKHHIMGLIKVIISLSDCCDLRNTDTEEINETHKYIITTKYNYQMSAKNN